MTMWYKEAVFYQISVRAFKDSNGDGHGDLRGLMEKLDYLHDLGIDCIWLMPIYPSPLKDGDTTSRIITASIRLMEHWMTSNP